MGRRAPRESFSDALAAWMVVGNVTQATLAARLGTSQATVSRYLSRTLYPSVPLALRLHAITGIDLDLMVRPPSRRR